MVDLYIMKIQNTQWRGYGLSFLGALFAAMYYIPYKKALDTVTPDIFVLGLFAVSFVMNTLPFFFKQTYFTFNKYAIGGGLLFAILTVLANYACGKSLIGLSPSVVVVILRTQVLLVMFLGWVLFKERINIFLWIGGFVALSGISVLSYTNDGWNIIRWIPIGWAFISMVSFALINIVVKLFVNKINPMTFNIVRIFFSFIIMSLFPGCLTSIFDLSVFEWFLISISAITGPILSRLSYIYAIKLIPISQCIIITTLSPVMALCLSWWFLDDIPSLYELIGGFITMCGIVIPAGVLLMKKVQSPSI